MTQRLLTGWGHTAPSSADVLEGAGVEAARRALSTAGGRGVLARGLGRSYGDAAQNGGGTVLLLGDHTITVDDETGVVTAGAGVGFDALIRTLLGRGWFVPVTPGTRMITVGGAIAADVHGKNHHADGSWGNHLVDIELLTPDGSVHTLSPNEDREAFWATVGGMGLTGVILACRFRAIRVESSRMLVDTWRTSDLDETMSLMAERDGDYRYTVAWIDSLSPGGRLGRGVVTMADHAPAGAVNASNPLHFDSRPLASMPPIFPSGLLNRLTIRAFNEAWYRKAPSERRGELQGISSFFHPLDAVGQWNRLYGARGMLQYQFVVPTGEEDTLRRAVERLSRGGAASFLTVLKRFGPGNEGHLSFPFPGWTLTLDVPTGVRGLSELLEELDWDLVDVGGRVYFAKDSRVAAAHVPRMYPRLDEWRAVCDRLDPGRTMQSDLSRRLGLRAPVRGQRTGDTR